MTAGNDVGPAPDDFPDACHARIHRLTGLVSMAALLAWAPFVTRPLSPDEGGFLLVASQWGPGTSLYGHYWVDRPPLLITIFALAAHLGGRVGLRAIGMAAVLASIVVTERLALRATSNRSMLPVVIAGVFLATPLFGTAMVNGELLAVPVALAGVYALVRACIASERAAVGWGLAAGLAAAAAPLIKQNVLDVLVVAAVLVAPMLRGRERRRALVIAATVLAGAGIGTGACLVWAETRGTEPSLLWDAVVTFRRDAMVVIQQSSTAPTSARFLALLSALALSGAPLVLVVLALRTRGPVPACGARLPDLRLAAGGLLLWELLAVGAGGSYWLHYLIGLVPGLVLLAIAAVQRPPSLQRITTAVIGAAGLSALVATVGSATTSPLFSNDARVSSFLRAHSTSSDSVVVGFGHPNIVYDSGLHSPYDLLWSLPVRVLDPDLRHLTVLLRGALAPTWVVVDGSSLATWGVDARTAERVLDARYSPDVNFGPYVVWRITRPHRKGQEVDARAAIGRPFAVGGAWQRCRRAADCSASGPLP
jgi:hypothetical protein